MAKTIGQRKLKSDTGYTKDFMDVSQMKKWEGYTDMFSCYAEDGEKHLTIYTVPLPKARPRFTRSGHAYTPKTTAEYESLIRNCWRLTNHGISTADLYVKIEFYMPIPKSMSKADRIKAMAGEIFPAKRPDIDNLTKAVLDALNEVAYWDDKQIVKMRLEKKYSDVPRIDIVMKELQ